MRRRLAARRRRDFADLFEIAYNLNLQYLKRSHHDKYRPLPQKNAIAQPTAIVLHAIPKISQQQRSHLEPEPSDRIMDFT